jgi:hypothetical protein
VCAAEWVRENLPLQAERFATRDYARVFLENPKRVSGLGIDEEQSASLARRQRMYFPDIEISVREKVLDVEVPSTLPVYVKNLEAKFV